MLTALNNQGQVVMASDSLKHKDAHYQCPGCRQSVYLKKGTIRIPHFSHMKDAGCHSFSEGETLEHLKGKEWLMMYFREHQITAQLEKYIPELKQRPDLFLPDYRLAVEFQCSPLSVEKMKARSEGYWRMGYQVVWIMGSHYTPKSVFTSLQKAFIQELNSSRPFFIVLNQQNRRLNIYLSFQDKPGRRADISFPMHRLSGIPSPNALMTEIEQKNATPFTGVTLLQKHKTLNQYRLYSKKEVYRLLYENRETLQSFPVECYIETAYDWLVRSCSFSWKFRLLKWLESFPEGTILHYDRIARFWHELIEKEQVKMENIPLMSERFGFFPPISFLHILTKLKLVTSLSTKEWIMEQKALRYSSEEQKIDALNRLDKIILSR